MQHIYRRMPMPKCEFLCNFVNIRFPHGSSSVNLLHIFRTLFPKNTCGRLPITNTWQNPKHTSALKKIHSFWKNYKISTSALGLSLALLTLLWRRSTSYRNQSINLLCKPMVGFLYDRDIRHKKVKTLIRLQIRQ